MANEFRKVTDLNGVDHPVCDDTRVAWADAGKSVKKNYGKVLLNTAVGGDGTAGYTIFTNNGAITLIAPIETGKAYKVTKKSASIGDRFKIVLFADYPSATATLNASQLINDATKTEYEFTNTNYKYATFFCNYSSNVSVSDIEPMICPASIVDDTYEPYIPDNTELMTWEANAKTGVHQLYYVTNPLNGDDVAGTIYTTNSDDSVSVTGTATGTHATSIADLPLPKGKYTLSVEGVEPNDYVFLYLSLRQGSSTVKQDIATTKNGAMDFDTTPYTYDVARLGVAVLQGAPSNLNLTLKPLIKLAEDTNTSVTPYAMTNRDLTKELYYQKGDVILLDNLIAVGYITSGKTELWLFVPLIKQIPAGLTLTLSVTNFNARGDNEYVIPNDSALSSYVLSGLSRNENQGFRFVLKQESDAVWNVSKNNSVVVSMIVAGTLTLS